MTPRLAIALVLAVLMSITLALVLEINADVRGLLGKDHPIVSAGDTAEGRALTVAIIHPDRTRRNRLASEIAARMAGDPLVARVMTAPGPSDQEALIDWLWRYRFELAPPGRINMTVEAMAAEMTRARTALISAADAALADRYLRDPTGSFRRLIDAMASARSRALPSDGGIPQARDDTAALIFSELAPLPFDVASQRAFDTGLHQTIQAEGAEALVIGPRSISSRISTEIENRTNRAAVIACILILAWLFLILRPTSAILICLLPPALGFLAGTLLVQTTFGQVHVIALGFGGALMGLAVDYPLHLLVHRSDRPRARRLIGLAVATTAIAFLALVGVGLPAFAQVGLFIAVGLAVAAIAAMALAEVAEARVLIPWQLQRPPVTGAKPAILTLLAVASAALIWWLPSQGAYRVVEVPQDIREGISRLDRMVGLPSAQYRIEVSGETLGEVLDRQAVLLPLLKEAVAQGTISRAEMLASFLPERPPAPSLPPTEAFAATAARAMAAAGLEKGYLDAVRRAYRQAMELRTRPASLSDLAGLVGLTNLVRSGFAGFSAPVQLWDVADPDRLAAAIADAQIAGVLFLDQTVALSAGLTALTSRVAAWFAIGTGIGLAALFAVVRRRAAVAEIAFGSVATGLATLATVGVFAGGIGVFHILALTLVMGIGIDYGCFLTLSESGRQFTDAARSVTLSAATTLIAFVTMALSGVNVLEDIGSTVIVGVLGMLGFHLLRWKPIPPGETK